MVTLMDGPVGRVLDFRVLDKKNRLGWLRSDGKRKERKTNIYGHLLRARHCARMAPLISLLLPFLTSLGVRKELSLFVPSLHENNGSIKRS